MKYSIKDFAALSNVTTRTLRYYDQIGLLKPAFVGPNGYRYYNQDNLLTLQQILFYREMDVPLKDIQDILGRPDFDLIEALQKHRSALAQRSERLLTLMDTIDQTIATLKGEWMMSDKAYFEGFDEEKYNEEAKQRWGSSMQYKESQKRWNSYSKAEKEKIKEKGGEITKRMVGASPDLKPDDTEIQTAISEYFNYINQYFYTCDVELLRSLAEMWESDPRFAENYDRIREGGAAFVHQAAEIWCNNQNQ